MAFQIVDTNKDGEVTLSDFQNLFNSYDKTGAARIDENSWNQILKDANIPLDKGKINFEEFSKTMTRMIRKSWLRKADRSPSKSPKKLYQQINESLAVKNDENNSPIKLKKCEISPRKSPYGKNINPD